MLPHLDLRSISDELRQTIESDDEARGILHRENGSYTGFVSDSVTGAARILAKLPLPKDSRLVLKTHDPKPAPAFFLPGENMVVTTFRDPLDVMVALYDQTQLELRRPSGTIRPAFLLNNTYEKALAKTEKFLTGMTRYFTPYNRYVEYPSFIRPLPQDAAEIARILGVDATKVLDTAVELDRDIRRGMVNAEFNRGETGRGRQLIDELVRNGNISRRLVLKAIKRYNELAELVIRHGCGVVARR